MIVGGGVDGVFSDDLSGGGVAGDDVVVVDEHQHGFTDVGASDAEVS